MPKPNYEAFAIGAALYARLLDNQDPPHLADVVAFERAEQDLARAQLAWRDNFRERVYDRLKEKIGEKSGGGYEASLQVAIALLIEWMPDATHCAFPSISHVLRFAQEGWAIDPTPLSREIEFLTEIERMYTE